MVSTSPAGVVTKALSNLLGSVFRGATWARYGRNYRSPIRPDRLLWIDPHRIRRQLVEKPRTVPIPPTHVVSGDWDRDLELLRDDVVFRSFSRHFVDNEPWTETEYVDFLRGDVSEHGELSREEALDRCRTIDQLYEYIETNGYLSQAELERRGDLLTGLATPILPPAYREIAVNITRDGELVWQAGMHRLAITQILDVQTIPVRVHLRHTQWQNTREAVYTTGERNGHEDHPDLEYLI